MASWPNPIYRVPGLTEKTCLPPAMRFPETAVALTEPVEIFVTLSPRSEDWALNPVFIEARFTGSEPSHPTSSVPLPLWVEPTIRALVERMQLPQNWDSYGAKAVTAAAVARALDILTRVMGNGSPTPDVVPLTDGGIQMEWHTANWELEITIPGDDVPAYYYQTSSSPIDEGEMLAPYEHVRTLVSNLS